MQKKAARKSLFKLVDAASLFILAVTAVLILLAWFQPLYLNRFAQYNVFANFTASQPYLQQKFFSVLDYLQQKQLGLDHSFYSREDVLHLQDVRNLYKLVYLLFFVCVIYLAGRYLHEQNGNFLKQPSLLSFKFMLIICFLITVTTVFAFDQLFLAFHKAVFTNDYWALDPATSNLIKFLPAVIFRDLLILLMLLSLCLNAVLVIITRHRYYES